MAGREKKPLSNKQLGVRKETDKIVKVTETTKEDEISNKTKESKQVQKDVCQGKKSALKKRSTGGIKSRKSLESTEVVVEDSANSTIDSATGGKPARASQNPKLRQTNKLNKTGTSQSGTNLGNELFSLSSDTKRSLSPRLCKTNKASKGGKQGSRTSEETNVSDDSSFNILTTKPQSPKLRRFTTQNKLGTGSPDVRNGTKTRNTPYITRSDSPARVLRNGKRRKLKDPSLLEGLDVGYPKRRRLLSTTRDGSGSELGCKSEPCLDDQLSIAGSDSSVYDFPRLENGKANWDSDLDSKVTVDETKNEEHSTHGVHSSPYSESQLETSHDSCLGKSISNKIAELIHRNKFLESIGKELVPKAEENLVSTKPSELNETNLGKCIENEKNLTDTNFNLCGPESIPSEKNSSSTTEPQTGHNCNTQNTNSENEVSETKEKVSHILPAARKVNAQDNAELKEMGYKNGQNISLDIALYHLREKSTRKVRDLKVMKSKKFFQECPSSSGVFYVVQNPSNVSFQKEGAKSVVTLSSEENQSSSACTDAQLASRDALVLNSAAEFENVAATEGGTSSVSVRHVVTNSSNVCTLLQPEKESTALLSQTLMDEADVLCVKNDFVSNVNLAVIKDCVGDFKVDRTDNEKDCDNKVDSDIKDDGSTVIFDSRLDWENAVIQMDSKNSNKLTSMDCENTANHNVETAKNDSVRIVFDNNKDPVGIDNTVADDCIKTVGEGNCVKDRCTGIKNECKQTVGEVDIKIDHNETVDCGSSGNDCKEILCSVGDGNKCNRTTNKPQKPIFSETSNHSAKTPLEQVIHADCESDAIEGGRSIRRSTRSSVGKVRAGMLQCMAAGRTKLRKLDLQGKSQDITRDEAESLSVCLTENHSTVDSDDVMFSNGKTVEVKGKQNDLEEYNEEIKKVESKEDKVAAESDNLNRTGELSLHSIATALTAQSVPSNKESVLCENDIPVKGDESSEIKENSLYIDELVEKGTNLDIQVPKESIVEPEKTDEEIISDKNGKKGVPRPNVDTSDVIGFASVGSGKIIDNEDSFVTEPTVKEESECTNNIESHHKLEYETDSKFTSEIVTHMKEDKGDGLDEGEGDKRKNEMNDMCEGQVHKLQNGIEPTLFYSKENLKEVKFCDSKQKSSDVMVKGIESDISENQCDPKNQECSSNKEELSSSIPPCSSEAGQPNDDIKSFTEEVFQKNLNVDQCDKTSGDGSEGILSDVNSVLHDVKQFDGGSLHEVSSTIDRSVVESSRSLDTEGNDMKATDSGNAYVEEEVSPEEQAIKESVLSALGLQPLRAAQAGVTASGNHSKSCEGNYTGTLKTVIKLQRSSPEKRRTPLKLVLKHGKAHSSVDEDPTEKGEDDYDDLEFVGHKKIEYSICKEGGASENTKNPFSFGIGSRKCLKPAYSYRYFDISSNPQFIGNKSSLGDVLSPDVGSKDDGKAQSTKQTGNLVIPEKSSSFSIHPGRLCSDVCSYCFGKFGSLDTPCHIAQLKSIERQQKVLQAESHLTADSCLCDACYRHVDRKANCPSYKPNKKRQHHRSGSSQIKTSCCVQGCTQIAEHHVRRKWLIKLKRSIAKKVRIDMDKMPQHLPFPLCLKHYSWIDYFMVCGICKRRLTRNHMYPLGPEVHELNTALASDGIPVRLSDKLFVCKLCRYFSSVRLKYKDPSQLAGSHKLFFQGYRKRLLHFHDIEDMDEETAEEAPPKPKRRKTKASATTAVKVDGEDDKSKGELASQSEDQHVADTFSSATIDFSNLGETSVDRSGASTPMIDYSTLGNGTSTSNLISFDDIGSSRKQTFKLEHVKPTKLKLKLGTSKISSLSYSQGEGQSSRTILLPERDGLEVTPVHDSLSRPFYPGQEELPLHADFEFHVRKEEETPNNRREWEKCTATIQFDKETKSLFQQLQRPYGNYSSFFRHLILLEKYWRSGELILGPNASSRAVNYVNSVQNRIHAYEGHPSSTFSCLSSPCSSSPHLSSTTSTMSVPVIDLPLKRRLGGGILTVADGSTRPVTITRMSGVSISPRPVTFTSVSSAAGVSSSQSRMPVFTTFPQISPSPVSRKVIMDTIATSAGSHFQQSRRIPNVLQVTTSGKSLSIVPGLTQIRHIQTIHQQQRHFQRQQQQQQQQQHQESSCFEPMICDVRSLATENGSGLWDQNVTQHTGKRSQQPNMSVSLLPKTNARTALKPSTIVTPTGIILSKKPEISVTAVTEKKDVSVKRKTVSGKRENVSKIKPMSEKLDLIKAKAVTEKKDIVLQASVSETKDDLPQSAEPECLDEFQTTNHSMS